MKIGVLGSGDVAKTLAGGFLKHGHEVMLGTRDPEKLHDWTRQKPAAQVGGVSQTAEFGELIVLAVKGSAALQVLRNCGERALAGKTLIDATNPITDDAPTNGVLKFFTNLDESLLEQLQKAFPNARMVKAFNSVGSGRMVNPEFAGGKPTMFICGKDRDAKHMVAQILDQFGWETEDMGGVEAARAIEPLCMLWCIPGFSRNQWTHAFKLLK
ncbi:MAG: NADPH-dependent F420 reductase [Steroidobacteraceae bacterium]